VKDFNLSRFKTRSGRAAPGGRRRRHEYGDFIILTRVVWEALATHKAGGSAYRVVVFLLHEAFRTVKLRGGRPAAVKLSNIALAKWGVSSRDGKASALAVIRKMEGLFTVAEPDKDSRKAPVVTVLCTD
jgi:hypothetical protein